MARRQGLFTKLVKAAIKELSKPKPKKRKPSKPKPTQPGVSTHTAAAGREWVSKLYRETDDGWYYEKSWPSDGAQYFRVFQNRPGDWRNLFETSVAGTKHRERAVKKFLRQDELWVDLVRDPDNEHDPNAIKVYGKVGSDRIHIGFVPAEHASRIVDDIPDAIPLIASVCFVSGTKIEFKVQVPSRTCPLCKGDLGRKPRQPGKCKTCGGDFALSPLYRVPIPPADGNGGAA